MKKSTRLRPAVESLESMLLLSTAMAEVHALAKPAIHVVAAESTTVALHGTLKGTATISGSSATVNASGNLGKIGTASVKTSGSLTNLPTSVTLTTKKGNLYLSASSSLVGSSTSGSTTYTITGGTKAYAHATGAGSVSGSYSVLKANKLSVTIRFT